MLSYAEAMTRARDLVPVLAERALKTEKLRRLPDETVTDLGASGLLRIAQPRRFGGSELSLSEIYDVVSLICEGCGSAGWVYSLLTSHGWMLALFGDQAQQDVWGADADAIISTSFAAATGPVEPVDGGVRIRDGRWRFSTGVHHATWVLLLVAIPGDDGPPDIRFALLPRDEIEIVEDWKATGLAGTGSCSLTVKDAFVPGYRTLRLQDINEASTPGSELNDAPLYRAPIVGAWVLFLTAPAVGIARGALRACIARTMGRVDPFTGAPLGGDPAGLIRLGGASARIDAGDLLMKRAAGSVTAEIVEHGKATTETLVRSRRDYAFGVRLCVEAVEDLFLGAGASSLDEDSPIQRNWRDVHAVAQHVGNNLDRNMLAWGEGTLGFGDGLRFG